MGETGRAHNSSASCTSTFGKEEAEEDERQNQLLARSARESVLYARSGYGSQRGTHAAALDAGRRFTVNTRVLVMDRGGSITHKRSCKRTTVSRMLFVAEKKWWEPSVHRTPPECILARSARGRQLAASAPVATATATSFNNMLSFFVSSNNQTSICVAFLPAQFLPHISHSSASLHCSWDLLFCTHRFLFDSSKLRHFTRSSLRKFICSLWHS